MSTEPDKPRLTVSKRIYWNILSSLQRAAMSDAMLCRDAWMYAPSSVRTRRVELERKGYVKRLARYHDGIANRAVYFYGATPEGEAYWETLHEVRKEELRDAGLDPDTDLSYGGTE